MNKFTKSPVHRLSENFKWYLFSGMLVFLFLLYNTPAAQAQRVALKTNLSDWITISPNLGAEFTLSSRLSLDIAIAVAPFNIKKDLYFKQIRLQPELKYWLQSPLSRHYIGVTAFYGTFDIGYKEKGYYGDSYAAGLTYGYNWILSRRWNFELSAGVGGIHYRLGHYTPGTKHPEPNESKWIIAPVKLGVSFIYVIK